MSNTNNDKRIMELRKQIETKKEQLNKSLRFSPITNCSIELDGSRYNIQVLQKNDLLTLMVKLNTYLMSARDLGIEKEYLLSGYKIEDWISDIKARIEILSRKDEERTLKIMEDKLHKLLSEDKKVELQLNEIESMLKG